MKGLKDFFRTRIRYIILGFAIFLLVIVPSSFAIKTGYSDLLNNYSGILGIATTLFAFLAWVGTRITNEERKRKRDSILKDEEIKQVALVIQNLNSPIEGDVTNFLKESDLSFMLDKELKGKEEVIETRGNFTVKLDKSIIKISVPMMPIKEVDDYFTDYSKILNDVLVTLKSNGISILHLFSNIPVTMGVFTGTRMRNNFTVIGYHLNRDASENSEKYFRAYDRSFESYYSEK